MCASGLSSPSFCICVPTLEYFEPEKLGVDAFGFVVIVPPFCANDDPSDWFAWSYCIYPVSEGSADGSSGNNAFL
jgi:hypothetical protein